MLIIIIAYTVPACDGDDHHLHASDGDAHHRLLACHGDHHDGVGDDDVEND